MARQLTLINTRRSWHLSERTKEIGRRGIAEARAALAATRPREDRPDPQNDPTSQPSNPPTAA